MPEFDPVPFLPPSPKDAKAAKEAVISTKVANFLFSKLLIYGDVSFILAQR